VMKVPAVHVVDVAVVVVVHPVARYLCGVRPGPFRKIRVGEIHAVIYDGDDEAWVTLRYIGGLRTVDVDVRDAAVLAGVVQTSELVEVRLVAVTRKVRLEVRLGVLDLQLVLKVTDGIFHRLVLDLDYLGVYEVELILLLKPFIASNVGLLAGSDILVVLHNNLAWHGFVVKVGWNGWSLRDIRTLMLCQCSSAWQDQHRNRQC
jgi:hypothetical protein